MAVPTKALIPTTETPETLKLIIWQLKLCSPVTILKLGHPLFWVGYFLKGTQNQQKEYRVPRGYQVWQLQPYKHWALHGRSKPYTLQTLDRIRQRKD